METQVSVAAIAVGFLESSVSKVIRIIRLIELSRIPLYLILISITTKLFQALDYRSHLHNTMKTRESTILISFYNFYYL